MRTIVVNIDHPDFVVARVRYAAALATSQSARLMAVHSVPPVGLRAGDLYGGEDLLARWRGIYQRQAAELKNLVETELMQHKITWQWVEAVADSTSQLIECSKLADLVLVGPTSPAQYKDTPPPAVAPSLVLHAAAPVLVVPLQPPGYDMTAPVIVAWNDSIEAARALKAALPLLRQSKLVLVINVDEHRALPMSEHNVLGYLSSHGVKVQYRREFARRTVTFTLETIARAEGAGCLVAGAYGAPRILEWLLGGVAHSLLADPALPVFMAH